MIDRLIRLGKDTAIYGLSSIVGRFLNFLLVPFYTHYLLPAEYGVIATLYSYIAFAFIVYGYGMESAYMRYVASLEVGDRKQNFSVPFLSLCATSLVISIGIFWSAPAVGFWIDLGEQGGMLIRYAAWILFFDALAIIPFASLRMQQKAKAFAGLKILNIVVNVVSNIVFIAWVGLGVEAVVLANLLASVVTVAFFLPGIARDLTFVHPKGLYVSLLKFGLPYIPAGLAGVAMHVVDRPILKALTDDATVGIYQANYRLGILMMLFVSMFDYAWRPFYLSHYKDADAKETFANIFTFFMIGLATVFVIVSLFVEDIIRVKILGGYFFHPDYWSGVIIVPWILLSYMFAGAYSSFIVGVTIEKKTHYLPLITGAGALVNVAANLVLVPLYGIMGAAYATLISYVVMAGAIYVPSQRLYRVPYDWGKIVRIAAVMAVVMVAAKFLEPQATLITDIGLKLVLFLGFLLLLRALGVVDFKSVASLFRTRPQ
jgi:O-antigen/teichoic acid export membrane protein